MTETKTSATLHDAFDAYKERLTSTDNDANAHRRRSLVERLMDSHADISLVSLDLAACTAMIDFWRQRPPSSSTEKPIARRTAQNFLSELLRFFRWLSLSQEFVWKAPADLEQVPRQIIRLASDRRVLSRGKFTVEHLGILYHHATPMQRLMLCLAMNCGLGAADMGRLKLSDFQFGDNDDLSTKLEANEGMLRFVRPKTDVYCEWLLWPETVEVAKWAIARAEELGAELVFVSDKGTPIWSSGSRNPASAFRNRWNQLLDFVDDYPVPRLPFGTLRKQMADLLHREQGSDVAETFLGHASVVANRFCCFDRRFRHLHEALRELRASLAPVFEETAE